MGGRSEGPPNGIFCPWVRGLDWAWTPEETSSAAAAAAVTRVGWGGQKPNPSFFDACGRTRDVDYGVLTARTSRFFFSLEKTMVFGHFRPRARPGPPRPGPGVRNPKIRKSKNPKIQDFGPKSMKFGFDRLCQGPKINFLPSGTPRNPQNPSKPQKDPKNPGFLGFFLGFSGF